MRPSRSSASNGACDHSVDADDVEMAVEHQRPAAARARSRATTFGRPAPRLQVDAKSPVAEHVAPARARPRSRPARRGRATDSANRCARARASAQPRHRALPTPLDSVSRRSRKSNSSPSGATASRTSSHAIGGATTSTHPPPDAPSAFAADRAGSSRLGDDLVDQRCRNRRMRARVGASTARRPARASASMSPAASASAIRSASCRALPRALP